MENEKLDNRTLLASKADLFGVAADPTRLQILCFMFVRQEACVSEIADALDASIATISHHLQVMKSHGIFETERMGTKICYKLIESDFTRCIEGFVC